MVDDGDQPTGSAARKAVPRSLSPDSPLPQVPAAASAAPCGGSVELQRLRSHVLPLEALGSSGSSSDEEREGSASAQTAAPLRQAAAPHDVRAGTCGPDARDAAQDSVVAVDKAAGEAPDAARCTPAGEVSSAPDALRDLPDREPEAKPPLIRHSGGALAGLLDGSEADVRAEAAEATAARFRRATGSLPRPAAAGDAAEGAGRGSAQRLPFASGKKRVGGWGSGAGMANRILAEGGHCQRRARTGLQPEHGPQLSDPASRGDGGATDGVELVQRQVRILEVLSAIR